MFQKCFVCARLAHGHTNSFVHSFLLLTCSLACLLTCSLTVLAPFVLASRPVLPVFAPSCWQCRTTCESSPWLSIRARMLPVVGLPLRLVRDVLPVIAATVCDRIDALTLVTTTAYVNGAEMYMCSPKPNLCIRRASLDVFETFLSVFV